jgi:hypothetical protein
MEIQRSPNDTTVDYDGGLLTLLPQVQVSESPKAAAGDRPSSRPHRPHHPLPQTSPATVRVTAVVIVTVVGVVVIVVGVIIVVVVEIDRVFTACCRTSGLSRQ